MICFRCMNPCTKSVCEHCGFDLRDYIAPMTALKPGSILRNRYVVGIKLGEGGFGITYVGYDNTTHEKVAIKEFYPDVISNRNSNQNNLVSVSPQNRQKYAIGVQKFCDEAEILKQLTHIPTIVKVYDFFQENNTAYIVMEYIDGSGIDKIVKNQGPLELSLVLTIYYPILEALEKVHEKGILHRDVSPSNVLLDGQVQPRLIDFGASRAYSEHLTSDLTVILKPGFAPMEQYTRREHHGSAEDIYALSASMYYTLTGKVPPSAPDRLEFDTLEPLSAYTREVSPELEQVILKGMAVRADDRFQSAREMMNAIDDALGIKKEPPELGETGTNPEDGSGRKPGSDPGGRSFLPNIPKMIWLLIGLGAACVILLILLIVLLLK